MKQRYVFREMTVSLLHGLYIIQMVAPMQQLKEQTLLYEDFSNSFRGYVMVKNAKKLVKHLERTQTQFNVTKDKVSL